MNQRTGDGHRETSNRPLAGGWHNRRVTRVVGKAVYAVRVAVGSGAWGGVVGVGSRGGVGAGRWLTIPPVPAIARALEVPALPIPPSATSLFSLTRGCSTFH